MNILEKYNIDIEAIIKKLPWKNWGNYFSNSQIISSKKWTQLQITCPFHADSSPSMWINKEKNAYNCFVCSNRVWESKIISKEKSIWRGTFIQLIRVFYEQVLWKEISDIEIANLFEINEKDKRSFLLDLKQLNKKTLQQTWEKREEKKYKEKEKHYKYSILHELDKWNISYLKSRLLKFNDITEERFKQTQEHFLLKTLEDGSIVIPIIKNWYLVWIYVRRNWNGMGKYYNLKTFKKTNIIYNWDFVSDYKDILLVEGPLNAIRLWSLWFENVVSLFWATSYKGQIELLNTKQNIYIWFDNDEGGNNGVKDILLKLNKWINIYSLQSDWKKDVYDYSREEILTLFKQFRKIK